MLRYSAVIFLPFLYCHKVFIQRHISLCCDPSYSAAIRGFSFALSFYEGPLPQRTINLNQVSQNFMSLAHSINTGIAVCSNVVPLCILWDTRDTSCKCCSPWVHMGIEGIQKGGGFFYTCVNYRISNRWICCYPWVAAHSRWLVLCFVNGWQGIRKNLFVSRKAATLTWAQRENLSW